MKKIHVGICYMPDQNEPSKPFLIKSSDWKDVFNKAFDVADSGADLDLTKIRKPNKRRGETFWADHVVENDEIEGYLFITELEV